MCVCELPIPSFCASVFCIDPLSAGCLCACVFIIDPSLDFLLAQKRNLKRNIGDFCGFTFEKDDPEFGRRRAGLTK